MNMIRRLQENDLDRVVQIWLEANLQAHNFISEDYWRGNREVVRKMLAEAELYVYEDDTAQEIQGFLGLIEDYIGGIFVDGCVRSRGIGKQLMDYVKFRKPQLTLRVYVKNTRAVQFYQREDFLMVSEGTDEETGEKEYTMIWKKK